MSNGTESASSLVWWVHIPPALTLYSNRAVMYTLTEHNMPINIPISSSIRRFLRMLS